MEEVINFRGKKYTLEKKLGEGAYGEAWLAISGKNKIVAKKITLASDQDDYGEEWGDGFYYSTPTGFYRETKLAEKVAQRKCPSLIKYLGQIEKPNGVRYILMEYFEGHTLSDFITCCENTGYVIHPEQFLKMAKHLFRGLSCLHSIGIVHVDIKIDNIMFNSREMKIIDFGMLCTTLDDDWAPCDDEDLAEMFEVEVVDEYLDTRKLAKALQQVLGNKFVTKYKDDNRTTDILNWVEYVSDNQVTALKALNLLDKIPGESEYLY